MDTPGKKYAYTCTCKFSCVTFHFTCKTNSPYLALNNTELNYKMTSSDYYMGSQLVTHIIATKNTYNVTDHCIQCLGLHFPQTSSDDFCRFPCNLLAHLLGHGTQSSPSPSRGLVTGSVEGVAVFNGVVVARVHGQH